MNTNSTSKLRQIVTVIIFIVLCLVTGFLGSVATQSSISTWYPTLQKPFFNPPNEWFAPVWTVLYVMMAVAGALIFLSRPKENYFEWKKMGLTFWGIQLVLNLSWSVLFFGLQSPAWALFEIIILLMCIIITIRYFYPIHRMAAYLMIPYVLWVSFATALNAGIWILN